MSVKFEIALDVDGVFAQFDKAFIEQFGVNPRSFEGEHGKKEFWKTINSIPNWFSRLEIFPGIMELYEYVKTIPNCKYYFLTAIPVPTGNLTTAADNKINWVHEHVDPNVRVETIVGGRNKFKYINPDTENVVSILIDDTLINCQNWIANGGEAILHDPNDIKRSIILLEMLVDLYE